MKKLVIFILSIISIVNLQAQNELPYKSLVEFKNDTTAFILYNFIDRAEQYKGKKLADVAKDLEIPIKIIVPQDSRRNVVAPIYIYIYGIIILSLR